MPMTVSAQMVPESELELSVDVLEGNCGTPVVEPDVSLTRIVGGTEARKNSWPWQCKLYMNIHGSWYGCGASIISDRYILTAAHCV